MENIHSFHFSSTDGVHQCFAQEWLPDGKPRAVVQIVHGIAEHIGRYDHVGRFLAGQGIVVCGEDHLGHGKTAQKGEYGFFAKEGGWELVCDDVRQLRRLQGETYPGVPYFLLGHSMGSFLARTYLCRFPGDVDGCILSGTGQENALLVAGGKALAALFCRTQGAHSVSPLIQAMSLGAYNKKFSPNRTAADWISRDEGAVDDYLADPLCRFLPTVSMFRDMMGGLQYISSPAALSRMDPGTPIYIFSGSKDPVGHMGKSVRTVHGYFEKQGTRDLQMKLYPEGRHEMFNEINRQEVLDDLLAWLNAHIH